MPSSVEIPGLPDGVLVEIGDDPHSPELLTPDERAIFERLRNEKRSAEWAAARSIAKRLVVREGLASHPAEVSIPTIGQRPVLLIGGIESPLHISLSHSGDYYAAALSEAPLGIDVQTARPIAEGALHFFLNRSEIRALGELDQSEALRIHFWVAKEAAFKFDHDAPRYNAIRIRPRSASPDGCEFEIEGGTATVTTVALQDGTVFGWSGASRVRP